MVRTIQQCLAVSLAAAVACSDTEVTAPSPLACYALTLGAWSGQLPEPLPPPPTALQLTDSLGTQVLENGRRVVRSMPHGSVKAYPFQYWVPREQGDLLVVFSNGFTGMTLDLTPSGAGAANFSGTARAFF
ncbi:MAG: hypothetical protein ACT4P6_09995 [Gemmatimonadaceae bacterium]